MFKFKFGELSPYKNSSFSRSEVSICYSGKNRNGSIITEEAMQSIKESLPGSPVVGFWNNNDKDFEEHNKGIYFNEETGELEYSSLTKPYGFVTNHPVQMKNIDGVDYMVAEVLFWTGRFPEVEKVLEGANNQSMEFIGETMQYSASIHGEPIITYAEISALCILGENVEPCFEEAKFQKEGFLSYMLKISEEEDGKMPKGLKKEDNENDGVLVGAPEGNDNPETAEPIADSEPEVVEPIVTSDPEDDDKAADGDAETAPVISKEEYDEVVFSLEKANLELEELRTFKKEQQREKKHAVIGQEMFALIPDEFKANIIEKMDDMTEEEILGKLSYELIRGGYSLASDTNSVETIVNPNFSKTVPAWLQAARQFNK